jgi:uncharacterized peroxidase-related enzyme
MGEDHTARSLATDYRTAELSSEDRAMLDYAVKLTLQPSSIEEEDVDVLGRHGFSDAAILDICQVASYYNYVNRLADGLGVELEQHWEEADLIIDRVTFETRVDWGRS